MEDGGDDGDGYDYSPPEDDFILTGNDVHAKTAVRHYRYLSTMEIAFTMALPKDMESRKQRIADGSMDIKFYIELRKNSPIIQIRMDVDNRVKDHRVRVMIPNLLAGKCSVSDNQFGSIRRPVVDEAMAVWEKEKWSERPDSIYPFLSYVHLGNREGLAVLTNSVREYEIVGKDFRTIAITVFRSVGVLGKEKLSRRPGRPSGIKMETPDSQMIGKYSFEFAVTADCMHAPQRAKEYVTPLVTYNKMPYNAMKLNVPQIRTPYCYSLLKLDNPLITMSVLKKEENGDHLLLRCYNGTGETQRGILETDYENAGEVMLDETHLSAGNGSKELTVEKNQIKTVLLKRNAG